MKRILRSSITYIVVFIVALIISLYHYGFRITYNPTLINDWDAISACASWFGALASAVAIFVAIRIPKDVAEQQNRIALFDKRYIVHDALAFLFAVVKQINDGTTKEMDPKFYLDTVVERYKSISIVKEIASDCKDPSDIFTRLVFEAGKIGFLFEMKNTQDVLGFLLAVDQYVSEIYKGNPADEVPLLEEYNKLDCRAIQEEIENYLIL